MLRKLNRIKSRAATKAKFWCAGCDQSLVGQVGKCRVCGNRANRRKRR